MHWLFWLDSSWQFCAWNCQPAFNMWFSALWIWQWQWRILTEVILHGWQDIEMRARSFPQVFISKLKDLQELMKNIKMRVYEKEERPKALDALKQHLNSTTVFLETVRNMTDIEDPIFTEVELTTLEKLINETKVSSLLVSCLDERLQRMPRVCCRSPALCTAGCPHCHKTSSPPESLRARTVLSCSGHTCSSCSVVVMPPIWQKQGSDWLINSWLGKGVLVKQPWPEDSLSDLDNRG